MGGGLMSTDFARKLKMGRNTIPIVKIRRFLEGSTVKDIPSKTIISLEVPKAIER